MSEVRRRPITVSAILRSAGSPTAEPYKSFDERKLPTSKVSTASGRP
jgi:hypothetical protein